MGRIAPPPGGSIQNVSLAGYVPPSTRSAQRPPAPGTRTVVSAESSLPAAPDGINTQPGADRNAVASLPQRTEAVAQSFVRRG
jgi:hypothetical protein